MKRLGALKGSGKKGYYNFMPKDPKIHSDSSRGIKQPQNLSFMQLRRRGINLSKSGDADRDGVPNAKDCRPLNIKSEGKKVNRV